MSAWQTKGNSEADDLQVKRIYYRVIYTKFTSLSMFDTYLSVYHVNVPSLERNKL